MAEARQKSLWWPASELMACVINSNPHRKKNVRGSDLNPFAEAKKQARAFVTVTPKDLVALFVKK